MFAGRPVWPCFCSFAREAEAGRSNTTVKRIGLLSDTHGTFDAPLRKFLAEVDEIWHAGDFGNIETADAIAAFKPLRGVYGNIDGGALRVVYRLRALRPKIFISGHSHILKVIYDKKLDLLHLNPGAAGLSGFHQVRTALRFTVDGERIEELEVGEWKRNMGLY